MSANGALVLSILLFITGLVLVMTKKNIFFLLIGVELIFNAANVNLVVFNQFWTPKGADGQILSLFVLAIVVAEMALALAISLKAIKQFGTSNINEMDLIKE